MINLPNLEDYLNESSKKMTFKEAYKKGYIVVISKLVAKRTEIQTGYVGMDFMETFLAYPNSPEGWEAVGELSGNSRVVQEFQKDKKKMPDLFMDKYSGNVVEFVEV